MSPNRPRTLAIAAALAAAVAMTACDRQPQAPTVGQQIDKGLAKAERKADEIRSDAEKASEKAGDAVSKAAGAVADATRDASITARINAELARDTKLSALRIDVDTVNGHVALSGTAPDALSRERATALAAGVDGVVAVDNRLKVSPRS